MQCCLSFFGGSRAPALRYRGKVCTNNKKWHKLSFVESLAKNLPLGFLQIIISSTDPLLKGSLPTFFPLSFAESLAKNLPLGSLQIIISSTNPLLKGSLPTFFPLSFAESLAKNLPLGSLQIIISSTNPLLKGSLPTFFLKESRGVTNTFLFLPRLLFRVLIPVPVICLFLQLFPFESYR